MTQMHLDHAFPSHVLEPFDKVVAILITVLLSSRTRHSFEAIKRYERNSISRPASNALFKNRTAFGCSMC